FSSVLTAGSGRPVTARLTGDANQDGNFENDRLSGVARNSLTGPDYFSIEGRILRSFHFTERWRLEASMEAFNLLNQRTDRLTTTDNGITTTSADFVPFATAVSGSQYPGQFRQQPGFLQPQDAYAPRQVQISLRLKF